MTLTPSSMGSIGLWLPYAGWTAVAGLLWKAGQRVGQIETRLNELAINHLPHLEAELRDLRSDFRAFITASRL